MSPALAVKNNEVIFIFPLFFRTFVVQYEPLEAVWILPLISLRRYFSVYLGFFLASLPSRFLQIDHYLLRTKSTNLLKKSSQLNYK